MSTPTESHNIPRRKKKIKKSKRKKCTKPGKKGYQYFENNILDQQHFKELYAKVQQIDSKMDKLQRRFDINCNNKKKKKSIPKKKTKYITKTNDNNRKYESAYKADQERRKIIQDRLQKLSILQRKAVCNSFKFRLSQIDMNEYKYLEKID